MQNQGIGKLSTFSQHLMEYIYFLIIFIITKKENPESCSSIQNAVPPDTVLIACAERLAAIIMCGL